LGIGQEREGAIAVAEATDVTCDAPTWPEVERRVRPDRRREKTPFWGALFGARRRRHGRRAGERDDIYVDVFCVRDVVLICAVFVLNICDAFFTLLFLDQGGAEANPIMERLLAIDHHVFLFEKLFVVGAWLVILAMHKNFRVARFGLWMALSVYASVVVYHLFLQTVAVPVAPHLIMEAWPLVP